VLNEKFKHRYVKRKLARPMHTAMARPLCFPPHAPRSSCSGVLFFQREADAIATRASKYCRTIFMEICLDLASPDCLDIGKLGEKLRMLFAIGMLIGAILGCTFGFVLNGILQTGELADTVEAKYRSAPLEQRA
jgi:hypothetical protein